MDPANDHNRSVILHWPRLGADNSQSVRGSPPSPGEVVEYLVHNEPLKYVAEISAHVDAYTSELKRDSRVMVCTPTVNVSSKPSYVFTGVV